MELIRIEDAHLTYPPRFRRHQGGAGDADDDLDFDEVVEDEREEPEAAGRPTGGDLPTVALRGVSLTVNVGDAVALLGPPKSGRTTLLSLMSGVLRPDAGSVLVRGYATGLPAASAGFLNFRTLRENLRRNLLLAGTPSARASELVPEVAEWAELTPYLDRRQSTLTRQQIRLAGQAVALHTEPTVFLADEDLAGVPRAFRRKAIERLAAYPDSTHALVVVTNRAELTRRMCTRGVVMNEGKITFDGPLEDGLEHYHRHHRKQPSAQEPQQEPAEPPEDTEGRGEDP